MMSVRKSEKLKFVATNLPFSQYTELVRLSGVLGFKKKIAPFVQAILVEFIKQHKEDNPVKEQTEEEKDEVSDVAELKQSLDNQTQDSAEKQPEVKEEPLPELLDEQAPTNDPVV